MLCRIFARLEILGIIHLALPKQLHSVLVIPRWVALRDLLVRDPEVCSERVRGCFRGRGGEEADGGTAVDGLNVAEEFIEFALCVGQVDKDFYSRVVSKPR